jgi:hypothetical protein
MELPDPDPYLGYGSGGAKNAFHSAKKGMRNTSKMIFLTFDFFSGEEHYR